MSEDKKYKVIIKIFIILFLCISIILYENKKQLSNLNDKIEKLQRDHLYYENILFLGDSITNRYDLDKYYSSYNVVNSGISGNQTNDILNDLDNRVYKYNPTKIFLLIGTNDLVYSGLDNESIAKNIEEIINKIHEKRPNTKIYLQSIYPVNSNVNEMIVESRTNENIKILNEKIENICNDDRCTYINMFDILKDKNGNIKRIYTVDGLHLSNKGYEVVTKELLKYINNEK